MLLMETNFDIYSSTVNDKTFDRRDLDYRRGELKLSKSYQVPLNIFFCSPTFQVFCLFVCLFVCFLSCPINALLDIFAD